MLYAVFVAGILLYCLIGAIVAGGFLYIYGDVKNVETCSQDKLSSAAVLGLLWPIVSAFAVVAGCIILVLFVLLIIVDTTVVKLNKWFGHK